MERTRTWRLFPCPPYDVEGMESWLGDMAARGWMLEKDGFFLGTASFVRGEPAHVRYRLAAAPKKAGLWDADSGAPSREARELNEDFGWEYVDRRGQFYIYRNTDSEARELETDPRVQALAIRAVEKRRRGDLLFLLVYWLLCGLLWFRKGSTLLLASYSGLLVPLLFLLVLLGALGCLLGELGYLRRMKRKLRAGTPPDHGRDWKKRRIRYFGLRAVFLFLFLLYCVLGLKLLNAEIMQEGRVALSDYPGVPPFATLRDFAEGEYRETWADTRFDYVSEWSNALLLSGMQWREHADVSRPDGTTLRGGLYVDYFAARSEWLARLIAAEYRRADRVKARKNYEPLVLPDLGLEEQAAYRNELHFPTLVLRRGCTVLCATFYQTGEDAPIPLEEWAAILTDSIR